MKNTATNIINAESYDEDKYYSEIIDIYHSSNEEDLERCKVIHQIKLELGIEDYEILSEIIMFCDIYKIDPHESLQCMDEGFVIFSEEMDKIMKFVNEEKINIGAAIEMVKRK